MNIYKISCHSDCGSYFGSYLQGLTVIAKDENSAIAFITKWMENPLNPKFIYPYERIKKNLYKKEYIEKWVVILLLEDVGNKTEAVIDSLEDSDY